MYAPAVAGRSLPGTAIPVAGVPPGQKAWRARLAVPFPAVAASSAEASATPSKKGPVACGEHIVLPATAVARAADTRGRAGRGEWAEVGTPRDEHDPVYLRCRIKHRIRRFFRPTLGRPLRFFIRLTR